MTDQELRALTPTAINEAVARKLGWTNPHDGVAECPSEGCPHSIPNYCRSIEAAFEIVAKVRNIGLANQYQTGRWRCHIGSYVDELKGVYAVATTAPMAICLAFLKLEDNIRE